MITILTFTKKGVLFYIVPVETDVKRDDLVKEINETKNKIKVDKCSNCTTNYLCNACIDESADLLAVLDRIAKKGLIKFLPERIRVFNKIEIGN